MQSSKIDFLGKYNELIQAATRSSADFPSKLCDFIAVSYTHLRAHETVLDLVCRLLLEKKTQNTT